MLNWGKTALFIFLFVCSGLTVNAQTNPAPFNLGGGNYFMGAWASAAPAFSYPPNMFFHTCARDSNPLLGDPTTANYTGVYNLGSGNRFAGLGLSGYSHFNYSKTPNTIGASVLGLNSTGRTDLIVTWTSRTWAVGNSYNIRLQYRISTVSPWLDVPGPIEYIYSGIVPNQQTISVNLSVATANAVDNRANMQVRWKYYYVSGFGNNSCNLSIDDINVSSLAAVGDNISTGVITGSPFCVSSSTSGSVTVPFTYASAANFTAGGCTFSAELSNSAGQFLSPTVIGTVVSNASGAQSIIATLPPGLGTGTAYRIRVTSDIPSVVGVDNGSDLTIYLSPFNVTAPGANCINLASNISWVLPVGCYNEIMVVAQPLVPFTVAPAGNGSAYIANATYGSGTAYESGFVVYKGPGTNVTINNLANATLYYFKIFVRYGNEWSSGEEVSCSPGAGTLLKRGDFLVMGVNATNSCGSGPGAGGASDDEISFVCFRDITIGTTLDITDNGYNRSAVFPGRWGDTEGVVRLTRTGGTIFAGTIITIRFDAAGNGFAISPDVNWTFTNLNSGGTFNLNVGGDQFHFMQGGNWINGGGAHDGIYTGTILFGFNTGTAWVDYANTSTASGLYPKLDCYVILPATGSDYIKYTGSLLVARTQRAWVDQINTVVNWTSYPGNCAGYNAAVPQYHLGAAITIVAGGYQRGKWLGAKNTDWYVCTNWEDFVVPDSTTDVLIPSSGVTFNCRLRVDSVHACRDLNIQGYKLIGADTNVRVLRILGNLNITGGELDFSDNNPNTKDGVIQLKGNWTNFNEAAFREGNSRVYFIGSSLQAINTPVKEVFYRLDIDNLAGISGGTNLQVENILTLTNGLINTGANEVYTTSTSVTSIAGHTLSRYINGKLRRQIAISGNYDFPVGTSTDYELANLIIASQVGMSNIIIDFNTPSGTVPNPGICLINGSSIGNMLDAGNWNILPNTLPTAMNLSLTLRERGHTNSVAPATRYGIIRRDDASSNWLGAPMGVHSNASQSEFGGTATAVRSGITTVNFWGNFAIGFGNAPLPVEWLSFDAKPISSNVLLQWKTASESGNDYFNVERSRDGTTFETIGQVQGSGTTSTISSYSFTDYTPGQGLIYYRLQQVDIDGRSDVSKIVPVRIGDGVSTPQLFPNPIHDQAWLMLYSNESSHSILEIMNTAGQLVFSETVSLQEGNNTVPLQLGLLPEGVYFLRYGLDVIKLVKY